MFNKPKTKLVIDALMFLCMAALAGIGFLMKYVLLPGKEAQATYGTKVDLYFLGLNRHEWGTIHLYIAFVLVGILVIHLALNWEQILNMFQKLMGSQMARKITVAVFIIVCVVLITFPFAVNPEIQEKAGGGGGGGGRGGHGRLEGTEATIQVPNSSYEIEPNAESPFVTGNIA